MKVKKHMIVSIILLAILIMGAVSASEDITDDTSDLSVSDDAISEDGLTVSNEGADSGSAPLANAPSTNVGINDEGSISNQAIDDEVILGEGDDDGEDEEEEEEEGLYVNSDLISFREIVGLNVPEGSEGRLVVFDLTDGNSDPVEIFNKTLEDIGFNDNMVGYKYDQYNGYYVFKDDLELGTGVYTIKASYYGNDGNPIYESDPTKIFLDKSSYINDTEIDLNDEEAILFSVHVFEFEDEGYFLIRLYEDNDDERPPSFVKNVTFTPELVGTDLIFRKNNITDDEIPVSDYCVSVKFVPNALTAVEDEFEFDYLSFFWNGEPMDDDEGHYIYFWKYNYFYHGPLSIVDNSKFRIVMDEEISILDDSKVFHVYCPENLVQAGTIINIVYSDTSIPYTINQEDVGHYVDFTLSDLQIREPGEYSFNILLDDEQQLVNDLEYEFGNPLQIPEVCVIDDVERNFIAALYTPEGFSSGSLIINDEEGNELFNKPLSQMTLEPVWDSLPRYTVKISELNEFYYEINEIYKISVSYVDGDNFNINSENDVKIVQRKVVTDPATGVKIELFSNWEHNLNDEEDIVAKVTANNGAGEVKVLVGENVYTYFLYEDEEQEGVYAAHIYPDRFEIDPGVYEVTVIYYDNEGTEVLSLSAEMNFYRHDDEEDEGSFEFWLDTENEFSTSEEDLGAVFASVTVNELTEGYVVLVNDRDDEFYHKALSDFGPDYVDGNTYKIALKDDEGNFIFEGFRDGDYFRLKFVDGDYNERDGRDCLIFFEEDTVRFEYDPHNPGDHVSIDVDQDDRTKSDDWDFVWINLPSDITQGKVMVTDGDNTMLESPISDYEGSHWWKEIDGHYVCSFAPCHLDWTNVNDEDTVIFAFLDEDGNIVESRDYIVYINEDSIRFEEIQHIQVDIWDENDERGTLYTDSQGKVVGVHIPDGFEGSIYVLVNGEKKVNWGIDWDYNDWDLESLDMTTAGEYTIVVKHDDEELISKTITVAEFNNDAFRALFDYDDGDVFIKLFIIGDSEGIVNILVEKDEGDGRCELIKDENIPFTSENFNDWMVWNINDLGFERDGAFYTFTLKVFVDDEQVYSFKNGHCEEGDGEDFISVNEEEINIDSESYDYDPDTIIAAIANGAYKVIIKKEGSDDSLYEKIINEEDWAEDGKFYIRLSDITSFLNQIEDKDVIQFITYDDNEEEIFAESCQVQVVDNGDEKFIRLYPGYEMGYGIEFYVFFGNLTTGRLNDEEYMGWIPHGQFIEIYYPEQLDDFTVTFGGNTFTKSDFTEAYAYGLGGYSYIIMLEEITDNIDSLIPKGEIITFTLSANGETFNRKRIRGGDDELPEDYVYKVVAPEEVTNLFDINVVDEELDDVSDTVASFFAKEDANPQSVMIEFGGGSFYIYVNGTFAKEIDNWDIRWDDEGNHREGSYDVTLADLGITEPGTYNIKITHKPVLPTAEFQYFSETELVNKDVTLTGEVPPEIDDPELAIDDIADVEEGSPVTISIRADEGFSYDVYVEVNGEDAGIATVTSGAGTFTIDAGKLVVGANTVKVSFPGDDQFNEDSVSKTFNVVALPVDPELVINDIGDVDEGSPVTIIINSNAGYCGDVTVTVNGEVVGTATLMNCAGSFEISADKLNVGVNTVKVSSEAAAGFIAGESAVVSFSVVALPVDPELTISVENIDYGTDATVVITTNATFTGVVKVQIGDINTTVTVTSGTGSTLVSGLDVGNYNVKAIFEATDVFAYSEVETTFVVNKATATVSSEDVTVTYPNASSVTIAASVAGEYNVKVGDRTYPVTVTENGGSASVPVAVMDVGQYEISVTADLGNNYNPIDTGVINYYKVLAGSIIVSGQGTTVTYPGKGTIVINTDVAGDYSIKVGDKTYDATLVAGANSFDVSDVFDAGVYDVKVSVDIPNYNVIVDQSITSYTVGKAASSVVVGPISFTYGGSGSGTVTLDGATGFTAAIDGYPDAVSVSGNVISVSGLPVDTYVMVVTTVPDANHEAVTINVAVTVNKADATVVLSADKESIVFGESVTLSYVLSPDGALGDVTYYLDGEPITGNVLTGLDADTYTVVAKYAGNDNYNAADSNALTITVAKAASSVSVDPISFTYGGSGTGAAALVGAETVTAIIDGFADAVSVSGNVISVSGLPAGDYSMVVSTVPDANHDAVSINVAVTVAKATPVVSLSADKQEITFGESVTLAGGVEPAEAGAVSYYVDGVLVDSNVLSGLGVGEHTVVAKVAESGNFNAAESDPVTITVAKAASSVSVDPISFTYGGSGTGAAALVGAETVTAIIDGFADAVSVSGNVISVSGLPAGDYSMVVSTVPDANHDAVSINVAVTVGKVASAVSVDPISFTYGGSGSANVSLGNSTLDLSGISVVNHSEAKISLSGNVITVSGLNAGKYVLRVTNTPNANYDGCTVLTNITVSKLATNLVAPKVSATYNVAKKLVVTLKDGNGNLLANKKVTIKVGTISKTLTTNEKGQVSVAVQTLVPKTYTATIIFAGDSNYEASSVKPKVVVAKAKPKLSAAKKTFKVKTKTKKVTATLKNNKGKVMKKIKLTLKIGKTTYKATTNKKGVATFKVKLTKKGKYTAKVKFAGNKYYKALSKKVAITVKG